MSIFGSILSKIFHVGGSPAASPQSQSAGSTPAPAPAQSSTAAPAQPVDVEGVLEVMAQDKGGGGNWRTSIVDLLKLLDLDSSLEARKQLAQELNVHAGQDGSAEQNIALSKAVWQKLADNGGVVPDSLRS